MRKIRTFAFTLFVCLLINHFCTAQGDLYEDIMTNTCALLHMNEPYGSGVILKDSNNVFLVTAKHCLFKTDKTDEDTIFRLFFDSIKIVSYPENIKNSYPDTLQINLSLLHSRGDILMDSVNDVCVVKIGKLSKIDSLSRWQYIKYNYGISRCDRYATQFNGFGINEIAFRKNCYIGDDIYISGFPVSVGIKKAPQFDYLRPLLKKGIISGFNQRNNTIIVDCAIHKGNSGGPVVRPKEDWEYSLNRIKVVYRVELIGIVSQFIPLRENWARENNDNEQWDHSGYSVIVPIEYALKLIAHFEQ